MGTQRLDLRHSDHVESIVTTRKKRGVRVVLGEMKGGEGRLHKDDRTEKAIGSKRAGRGSSANVYFRLFRRVIPRKNSYEVISVRQGQGGVCGPPPRFSLRTFILPLFFSILFLPLGEQRIFSFFPSPFLLPLYFIFSPVGEIGKRYISVRVNSPLLQSRLLIARLRLRQLLPFSRFYNNPSYSSYITFMRVFLARASLTTMGKSG